MAISNVWKPFGIRLNHATTNVLVVGLTDHSLNPNLTVNKRMGAGSVNITTVYNTSQTARFTGTTLMVEQLLDVISTTGICFGAGETYTSIDLIWQRHSCGGIDSMNYRNVNVLRGKIFPTTMSCDFQGDLSLGFTIEAISNDGSASPLSAPSDANGAPTEFDQAFKAIADRRWTMHDSEIGDLTFDHKKTVSLDFGNDVQTDGADGSAHHDFSWINGHAPVLTATGLNLTWWNGLNLSATGAIVDHNGTPATANTVFFFKRRDAATPGTNEHIAVMMGGMAHVSQFAQGSHTDPAQATVQIDGAEANDGTVPLVIDTDAAIAFS